MVAIRVASRFAPKGRRRSHPPPFTSVAIWPTSVLVGQIHSTAVDLLRASGMHLDEAAGEPDGAVRGSSSERRDDPGARADVLG